jgi:hypothetical protein
MFKAAAERQMRIVATNPAPSRRLRWRDKFQSGGQARRFAATRRAQDAKLSNRGNSYEGIFLNLIGYRERVLGSFKLSSLKSIVEMNSTFETASLAYSRKPTRRKVANVGRKRDLDAETRITCWARCLLLVGV